MDTENVLQFIRLTHRQAHQRFGQALYNFAVGNVTLGPVADAVVGTDEDPYFEFNESDPRTQAFIARIRSVLG